MAGGDVDHMGRLVVAAIPSNHLAEELASHEHSLVSAVLLLAFLRLFRELLTALLFTLRARETCSPPSPIRAAQRGLAGISFLVGRLIVFPARSFGEVFSG